MPRPDQVKDKDRVLVTVAGPPEGPIVVSAYQIPDGFLLEKFSLTFGSLEEINFWVGVMEDMRSKLLARMKERQP